MELLVPIVVGFAAGIIGTGLGGALPFVFKLEGKRVTAFLLAAAAGVMTSISLLELVPEAVEAAGGSWAAVGLVLGTLGLYLLDRMLPHIHRGTGAEKANGMIRTGILICLGISLHNFPEGLAIGAGYAHEAAFGLNVAILIALQNIPEGVAMAVPLRAGNVSPRNTILAAVGSGIPMGLGAALGLFAGSVSPIWLSISLSSAAGAMMYVVSDELIPEAHALGVPPYPTTGLVTGIIVGVLACFLG